MRYRQSSLVDASKTSVPCGHPGPSAVALRMPSHRAGGTGLAKRSGPTGGLAYGTPRNNDVGYVLVKAAPWRAPYVVLTMSAESARRNDNERKRTRKIIMLLKKKHFMYANWASRFVFVFEKIRKGKD